MKIILYILILPIALILLLFFIICYPLHKANRFIDNKIRGDFGRRK